MELRRVGSSTALPGEFTATYRVADGIELAVHVDVTADGAPRCREVRVYATDDAAEVQPSYLRHRKLENLIEHACMSRALMVTDDEGGAATFELPGDADDARGMLGEIRTARARRRRGRGYPADLLREVADAYRAAETAGEYPTKAVRDTFGVAQSTAQLYVRKARDAGLLPAPRRKGQRS